MIESQKIQLSSPKADEPVKTRIQFKIPQTYHQEPIIYNLISDYELRVNLISAILGKDGLGGGCFDLELRGYQQQIECALNYLSQLNVEIWHKEDYEATS